MKRQWNILAALCALFLLLAVGCTAGCEEDYAVRIDVTAKTAEPVYSMTLAYGPEGDVRASSSVMNADGTAIRDACTFGWTAEELSGLPDREAVEVTVSITTEPGDEAAEQTVGSVTLSMADGCAYDFTIEGSAADGYRLTVQQQSRPEA